MYGQTDNCFLRTTTSSKFSCKQVGLLLLLGGGVAVFFVCLFLLLFFCVCFFLQICYLAIDGTFPIGVLNNETSNPFYLMYTSHLQNWLGKY